MAKDNPSSADQKPMTKSQIVRQLAEENQLTQGQVNGVFDSLEKLMKKQLGRRGPGVFNVPGLLKIRVVKKPATKSRKGVNPFTGEQITIKAKPARRAIKVTALKRLKEMA